jgi:hypothetical protein
MQDVSPSRSGQQTASIPGNSQSNVSSQRDFEAPDHQTQLDPIRDADDNIGQRAVQQEEDVMPDRPQDRAAVKANWYCSHGHFSKAIQALSATAHAEPTPENIAILSKKFPVHRFDALPPPKYPDDDFFQLDKDIRKRIVRSCIANGSAQGALGISGELLQQLCMNSVHISDFVHNAIEHLMNNKPLTDKTRDVLLVYRLMAFDKSKPNKPNVRPIAIGNPLIKMCEYAALHSLDEDAIKKALPIIQLGVGTHGGCEIVINAIRDSHLSSVEHNKGRVIIKRDAANAFNSIYRFCIMEQLNKHENLRPLRCLFRMMYGHRPPLMVYHEATGKFSFYLQSRGGVHQGSVSGSVLYSIGQQGVLEEVASKFPDVIFYAIIDDVIIDAPTPQKAMEAYKALDELMETKCGVKSNHDKAAVLYGSSSPMAEEIVKQFKDMQLPEPTNEMETLGAIIASLRRKADRHAQKIADQVEDVANAISHPAIALQNRLLLTRHCLASKCNYIARCSRPSEIVDTLAKMDKVLLNAAYDVLDASPKERNDTRLAMQIGLPLKLGGMGIRPLKGFVALAAWWSAQAAAARHILEDRKKHAMPPCTAIDDEIKSVWKQLMALGVKFSKFFPNLRARNVDFFRFYSMVDCTKLQHHLTEQMDMKRYEMLVEEWSGKPTTRHHVARLKSLRNETAHLPLLALRKNPELYITDQQLRIYLRERFGLTPSKLLACCACGHKYQPMENPTAAADELHYLKCNKHTQGWIASHNEVVKVLEGQCRKASLTTFTKHLTTMKKEYHVIPDLCCISTDGEIAIDVTLTTSDAYAYTRYTPAKQAAAAKRSEDRKIKKYEEMATDNNIIFYPFAVERNTCAFGPQTLQLLAHIGRLSSSSIFLLKLAMAVAVVKSNEILMRNIISKDSMAERQRRRQEEESDGETGAPEAA